jgi:hypothetical protein
LGPTSRRALLSLAGTIPSARLARASGRRFHVAPDGDDAAGGLTERRALRTLAALARVGLQPGDEVLLRRGGTWHETLRPPISGAPGRPIRFGAYGDGPAPRIACARPVEGWRSQGGTWVAALPQEPAQVFLDGSRLSRLAGARARGLGWYWSGGLLTLAGAPGAAPPRIEAAMLDFALDARDRAHLVVEELQFAGAGWHAVMADTLDASTIRRCAIRDALVNGIQASSDRLRSDLAIEECAISGCGGSGIALGGRLDRWHIRGNRIRDCCTLHEAEPGAARRMAQLEWSAGIKAWGWGQPGFHGSCTVEENLIEDLGPREEAARGTEAHKRGIGIWWDEVIAPAGPQMIRRNTVARCQSRGIYVEKCDEVRVHYNLIRDSAVAQHSGALALQANSAGYDLVNDRPGRYPRDARRNSFRHNTVIARDRALEVVAEEPGCRLEDNEIADNILLGGIHVVGGGANDGVRGRGNAYRRNCLGPEGTSWRWDRATHRSYAALEAASRGAWSGSPRGDPRFTDQRAGDYRLRPGSPCLDSGTEPVEARDLAGVPVPQGAAPDAGCHETRR